VEFRPGPSAYVEAHHKSRLVAIQQTPENRPGDDAGEVKAQDDEAHRRTRAGQLQHEPEQGDDGEQVPEIRDAHPQPKPLERGMAQWSANSSGSRHEPMILQFALVLNQCEMYSLLDVYTGRTQPGYSDHIRASPEPSSLVLQAAIRFGFIEDRL